MTTLLTARFDATELERLEAVVGPVRVAGYGVDRVVLPPAELLEAVRDVHNLFVEYEDIDARVLDAAPQLRLLACCRNEPFASVDLGAATARGIPVLYTPGRNATAVAEYTIGLMLAVTRGIAEAHHALRHTDELTAHGGSGARRDATAQWSLDPGAPFDRFQGPELAGRTVGVVGFGFIGRRIADLCRAFGMRVVVTDPYVAPETVAAAGVERLGLLELAAESDVVALAAKVTPETRGIVSADFLAAMRPQAYLVNTARAALVDGEALVAALAAGSIAGAALDVYPTEPLPADSALRRLDNVVLSPHIAGASVDVVRHHSRILVDDVARIRDGERPRFVANPEVLDARGGMS